LEEFKSTIGNYVGDLIDEATERLLPFPYINVRAKCSMGYEEWGSKEKWRPRKPDDVSSGSPVDPEVEAKANAIQEASTNYKEALRQECDACCKAQNAWQEYIIAQGRYDECTKSTTRSDRCSNLRETMEEKKAAYDSALSDYNERYRALQAASARFFKAIDRPEVVRDRCKTEVGRQMSGGGLRTKSCDDCNQQSP
jgi:hypothetical protein